MDRILLVEPSATRRRAMHALLAARGFAVSELSDYAQALPLIERLGSTTLGFRGIVIGWPEHSDALAEQVFAVLHRDEFEHFAVLLLADTNDGAAVNWMMKRASTGLLLWSDYSECAEAMAKLLNPPSPVTPDLDIGGQSHLRVLFVDDSATVRIAFRRLLMKHGYLVETAEDVEDGWRKAQATAFDLAIVDYFMPGDPGTVLVQRMKNDARTANVLSAVITGTYSDRVINESLAAGALECLFKSEARELFLARLGSLARTVQDRKSVDAERRRLQSILSSVGDGVYGVDSRGTIQFVNPAALDMLGYAEAGELVGESAHDTFHHSYEDGTAVPRNACFLSQCYAQGSQVPGWQTVFWSRAKRPVPVECTVYPMQVEGRREGSVVAFRDISARRMLEEELRWQASHDALTKLNNRAWFETQLEQEIARLKRTDQVSLLLFLDLDRFKYINDTAGHTAGDQLLVEISRRLSSRLRASDHIARMGGDEYAVILRNVNNADIAQVADEFRKALGALPFAYGGKSYRVGTSIGVARLDQHTPSRSEAMAAADVALHLAKRNGRNQIHVFSADTDQRARMDMELGWSARLESALKNDGFALCFQPILPLANLDYEHLPEQHGALWTRYLRQHGTQQRMFYEILIRLRAPDGSLVAPNAFLPAAERFSMVADIDRWVIRHAFQVVREQNHHDAPMGLSINLAAQSLAHGNLGGFITDCLVEFDVDPRAVVFEVTEAGALNHLEAVRHLIAELKPFGCRFALDDFGIGFSSFAHLKHLDVDFLKIDGSFIRELLNDPVDLAVISAITNIAHSIGKIAVAEHVDRPEILRALHACGVDQAQGFYIGRPQPSLRAANGQLEIVQDRDAPGAATLG
ncbi:MAG: EAL domain-containing protein [Xanthomonadaceae bacterium]|nr:EAL domain-containing protein [Xanthomonadaceae bacterium]